MRRIILLAIPLLMVACIRSASKPAIWPEVQTPTGLALSSPLSPSTPSPTDSLPPTSPLSWCPEMPISLPEIHLRVVYVAEGDLWLWDEGGIPVKLTLSGDIRDATISSDGQVIGYTRQVGAGSVELWAMGSNGTNPRLLVTKDEFTAMQPGANTKSVIPNAMAFNPSSHSLAFNSYPQLNTEEVWIYEPTDLWLVDTDTGQKRNLQPGGYFDFSPTGQWVSVLDTSGLSIMKPDGNGLRKDILPAYRKVTEGEGYYYPRPVWLADSSALVIAIPDSDEMYTPEATFTVWRVPVENGTPLALGTFQGFPPSAQFSPDGKLLTYWRLVKAQTGQRDIHLASTGGGQDIVYANGKAAVNITWSERGNEFLFNTGEDASLWLGKICGEAERLTSIDVSINTIYWAGSRGYLYETGVAQTRRLHIVLLDQPEQPITLGPLTAYAWAMK